MWPDTALQHLRPSVIRHILGLFGTLLLIWSCATHAASPSNPSIDLASTQPSTSHAGSPQMTWRVAIPFAPFQMLPPHVRNSVSATATPLSGESFQQWAQRIASSSDGSPFAHFIARPHQVKTSGMANATPPGISNPWDNNHQRYQPSYVHPTHTDILVSLQGALPNALCRWRQGDGPLSLPTPCAAETLLEQVPLTGAQIQVQQDASTSVITASVKVEHKVIVALGDSYASGEGNPDIPTQWYSESVPKGTTNWINVSQRADALWWDNTCHRSFYSNQTFVALRLAFDSPHRLVTYLHYACSGAEVFDGLLVPQQNPPGISETCRGKDCLLPKSQLAMMVQDLCTTAARPLDDTAQVVQRIDQIARTKGMLRMHMYDQAKMNLLECPDRQLRQPDLILMSIGGNDIGFANLVRWVILPERFEWSWAGRKVNADIICPDSAEEFDSRCKADGKHTPIKAGTLIAQLPARMEALHLALAHVLHPGIADRIVHATYPDPIRRSRKKLCYDSRGLNTAGPWASLVEQAPGYARAKKWHFNAVWKEVDALSNKTLPILQHTLQQAITRNGAHDVDLHNAFLNHGWCQQQRADEPPIALPSAATAQQAQAWTCDGKARNPSCWNAYAPSQRYIRTANDAFLTQHSKNRSDGSSGMMHPNLPGHAEMATHIYPVAQRVLQ